MTVCETCYSIFAEVVPDVFDDEENVVSVEAEPVWGVQAGLDAGATVST